MSDLPQGWVETTLGELFDITSSRRVHQHEWTNEGVPFYRAREIKKLARSGSVDNDLFISEELFEKYSSQFGAPASGDLMVTAVGTLGECYQVREGDRFYFKDASVLWLRKRAGVNPDYVAKMFLSKLILDQVHEGGGTTVGTYTIGDAKDTVVAFPPVAEQRRIVAKIDGLTGKSRRARDHLEHIPRLVEKYKQAVLAAAFRGDLTREWRAGRALEWRGNRPLKELCVSVTDGDHQAPPKATNGIPFITISAMNDGLINLRKATRFVPETYFNSLTSTRRASRGDVLYSVTGSFGISALVDFDDPFVFQRHIAILRPDPGRLDALFLFRMLSSPEVMEQADSVATGTAQRTVPLSGLRSFTIPAPSLSEQHEIVRRLEIVFDWINRLASEATSARRLIDKLDQAVLAKAFRGELVPHDPDDEPAIVLLERIRAAREAAPKAKRGRRAK
jgi:type I restriction enzyme S subunit